MKIFLTLVLGIALGAFGLWFYNTEQGRKSVQSAGEQLGSAAKSTKELVQEKLRLLDLRTNDIKDELVQSGKVVRRKAREAGQAIADATADARVTTAIKTKLLASHDLSALSISVNTTGGVVTLSGAVPSEEAISKAMLLAMDTDGVREVISTLQVKR